MSADDETVLAGYARDVLTLAERQPRVLLGLVGAPGAGKSTLAAALVRRIDEIAGPGTAVALPMDGFHLANATLDRLGLRERKGAIETFDGWGFVKLVERLRSEDDHDVYAPGFDRSVDEGVAGSVAIPPTARIVVIEGNYLLVDAEPWRLLAPLLDEVWWCEVDPAERTDRLVARHIAGGRTEAAARDWARDVDGANASFIESTRARAARVVRSIL